MMMFCKSAPLVLLLVFPLIVRAADPSSGDFTKTSVIRVALPSEKTQEVNHRNVNSRAAFLWSIKNIDTGEMERQFPQKTNGEHKLSARGAEVRPGNYRVALTCTAYNSIGKFWQDQELEITADAGNEYLIECGGEAYTNRNHAGVFALVTKHPLTHLVDGVSKLGDRCNNLFDVPLLARLATPKCTEQ